MSSDEHQTIPWGQGQMCTRCQRQWDLDDEPPTACVEEAAPSQTLADIPPTDRFGTAADVLAIGHQLVDFCHAQGLLEMRGNYSLKPLLEGRWPRQIAYHWQRPDLCPQDAESTTISGRLQLMVGATVYLIDTDHTVIERPRQAWWFDSKATLWPTEQTARVLIFEVLTPEGSEKIELFYDRIDHALTHERFLSLSDGGVTPILLAYSTWQRMAQQQQAAE